MAALTIGNIRIQEAGLLLAPMEDVTDRPFRMICKEQGADIVYTEFVNAEGLIRERERGSQKTQDKLDFGEAERPLGIQIYGASELSMEAATQIATAARPDLIDINCGCWVSNVALRGAGAGPPARSGSHAPCRGARHRRYRLAGDGENETRLGRGQHPHRRSGHHVAGDRGEGAERSLPHAGSGPQR